MFHFKDRDFEGVILAGRSTFSECSLQVVLSENLCSGYSTLLGLQKIDDIVVGATPTHLVTSQKERDTDVRKKNFCKSLSLSSLILI